MNPYREESAVERPRFVVRGPRVPPSAWALAVVFGIIAAAAALFADRLSLAVSIHCREHRCTLTRTFLVGPTLRVAADASQVGVRLQSRGGHAGLVCSVVARSIGEDIHVEDPAAVRDAFEEYRDGRRTAFDVDGVHNGWVWLTFPLPCGAWLLFASWVERRRLVVDRHGALVLKRASLTTLWIPRTMRTMSFESVVGVLPEVAVGGRPVFYATALRLADGIRVQIWSSPERTELARAFRDLKQHLDVEVLS